MNDDERALTLLEQWIDSVLAPGQDALSPDALGTAMIASGATLLRQEYGRAGAAYALATALAQVVDES